MTPDRSHSDTFGRIANKVKVEGGEDPFKPYFQGSKYLSSNTFPAPEIFSFLLVKVQRLLYFWEIYFRNCRVLRIIAQDMRGVLGSIVMVILIVAVQCIFSILHRSYFVAISIFESRNDIINRSCLPYLRTLCRWMYQMQVSTYDFELINFTNNNKSFVTC